MKSQKKLLQKKLGVISFTIVFVGWGRFPLTRLQCQETNAGKLRLNLKSGLVMIPKIQGTESFVPKKKYGTAPVALRFVNSHYPILRVNLNA
jgi:hypothetical protein